MSNHLELLKQLALEVIDEIPLDSVKIYTDGNKGDTNTTGSRVLIELYLAASSNFREEMLIMLLSLKRS
ncbi:hypothetical protein TNCV_4014301 [Trichonephila clavipes]|nr:hypothetical protein TNCV_4014301 [Trichonephila clavipes]